MDNGIGRTGYRLLALVFLAVGLLGLLLAWYTVPTPPETALSIASATVAAALVALFFLSLVLTAGAPRVREAPAPDASALETPAPTPPASAAPTLDFEYDEQPARTEPMSARDDLDGVLERADGAGRPSVSPTSGDWPVRRPKHARSAEAAPPSERNVARELADRYTEDTPMVRSILSASHEGPRREHQPVREVTAKRVEPGVRPGDAPAGTKMGRCGGCNTVLLAPTERPLRLRCPRCRRVTLLKE